MNRALYVRRCSVNLIRDLTTNQCSDLSRGLDSESLLDLVTTRARRFCTRCKLVLHFSEQPNSKELQQSRRLLTRALARENGGAYSDEFECV